MAAINVGILDFDDIVRGELLDMSFDVEHDLDFTGKTIYSEVRKEMDSPVVLSFTEEDGSLTKTDASSTLFDLRFLKTATEMEINTSLYHFSVIYGTAPDFDDKQTIIVGKFNVIEEITQKP